MNKFFEKRFKISNKQEIKQDDIEAFRVQLIAELTKLGASDNELNLVHDATIRNSIRNKRNPEDVAWAILQ